MSFRLNRWASAVILSFFLHAFFLKSTIFILPLFAKTASPEIFFLGPILISPEVRGEWSGGGENMNRRVSQEMNRRFWKGESRFAGAVVEKPVSWFLPNQGSPQEPDKTIFPLDDILVSPESSSEDRLMVPKESYQPLRLERHDSN